MADEKPFDLREEWDEDREDYRQDQRWLERVPTDDLRPQVRGVIVDLPFQDEEGSPILGPDGRPFALRDAQVSRTDDEVKQAWARKQEREPCWMCRWFHLDKFTLDQKRLIIQAWLKKAGRWSEKDALDGRLGEYHNFGYCDADKTLTHKDASCVPHWQRRPDL